VAVPKNNIATCPLLYCDATCPLLYFENSVVTCGRVAAIPEWLVAVGDSFSNWGVADLECGAERVCVFSTNSVSNVAQECAKRTDCVGFEMRKYPVPSGHLKKESPLKQAGPSDKSYPTRSTYCIANRSQLCTTVGG